MADYVISASGGYGGDVGMAMRRPVKSTRRRIVCPTLPAIQSGGARGSSSPEPSSMLRQGRSSRGAMREVMSAENSLPGHETFAAARARSEESRPERSLTLPVRVIYFSRDGDQADAGGSVDFEVTNHTTVEALLEKVREKVGAGKKGRLLYKGRPVATPNLSIESAGLLGEPKAVHFMLSRKHRPQEVSEQAEKQAAELAIAMAMAEAEAAARGPRQRKQVDSPRPGTADSIQSCGMSGSV